MHLVLDISTGDNLTITGFIVVIVKEMDPLVLAIEYNDDAIAAQNNERRCGHSIGYEI